ncbi:MAG: hypothetical protein RDV48_22895 [Candidatus Eremiobacteraeota bacterium]|nr:hypothetical protein [Candidatus Eremiobacteraeota bacterium]
MSDFMQSIAGGMMGSIPMGIMFGPIGGMFGFASGMFGASSGIQGNPMQGFLGGAAMGGLCGMTMGNPLGGAIMGGATAGLLALIFNNCNNQQSSQQSQMCPYYPQPPYYGGGGYNQYGGNSTSLMGFPGYNSYGSYGNYGSYANAYAGQGGSYANAGYYPPYQQPQPPMNYGGQLSQDGAGKPITYKTSGGWNVEINGGKLTITDPSGKHKVEHSGDPHEYVDGKHIKDWDEKTRSLILADGTKITMNATGPQGVIENYSIYDGAESIKIDANGNKIQNVSYNPYQRYWNDANQTDGETAYVGYGRNGNFIYKDIYKQDENLNVTPMYRDLARVDNHWWNNKHVHDLYDDPRLGGT